MTSLVRHVTFDCADPYKLASFWAEVFGTTLHPEDQPGDGEVGLVGSDLLFIQVPESKAVKNRVHVDLQPQDRTRDEEVERLLTIGATLFADHRNPDGTGWAVLLDPEGNEFCVERSRAEREQS
ncbi:MAG: VOC family protein [Catenulispora sp.]|nr:VOC family protein [Catenulispora sp.]